MIGNNTIQENSKLLQDLTPKKRFTFPLKTPITLFGCN